MSLFKTQKNKSVLILAVVSAIASVLFSFMGAPFMRALFISTKSRVFWITATLLIGALFFAGSANYKISETAVYVGAIWMTLGAYSELEKHGVRWLSSILVSLSAGLLFALAGYFLILKNLTSTNLLIEMVEPLHKAIIAAAPGIQREPESLVKLLPGIFVASLFASLAVSIAFESRVAKIFKIQRERVASGLHWLGFSLPAGVIWTLLFAALYTILATEQSLLLSICENLLIVLTVAFFFQGIAVTEVMLRVFRFGPFMRMITYILIVIQLAPLVVFVGFVDYWVDFRTLVRKKIKSSTN